MTRSKKIAIVGPVYCRSGIATVINSVISQRIIKNSYGLLIFNSTNYLDSSGLTNMFVFLRALLRFFVASAQRKIGISHIHTSYQKSFYRKFCFVMISSLFKIKTILHFHTGRFEKYFINATGLRKKMIRFCLKRTDAAVVLCEDWKTKLRNSYGFDQTFVIHNPLSLDLDSIREKKSGEYQSPPIILFFGFMLITKGIYDIISIAALLEKKGSDFRIVMCGKGQEEENFLKVLRKEGLENVEYLGWVTGKRRLDLLRDSYLFLLPTYYEGINNSILEAMAFGLPVVSTGVGGTPEMVIDGVNGYLLTPGDIKGFAERINFLLSNPDQRNRLGENSWKLVQEFKKERISEQWDELYRSFIQV